MNFPRLLGSSPLPAPALGKSRSPADPAPPWSPAVEQYLCERCGRELFHLGDDPPPTRCEDCIPETGQGSRLVEQVTINLRKLRRKAGIETYVRELRDLGRHLPYRRPPRRAVEIAARRRRRSRCAVHETVAQQ